jgi:hypothetical protein
MAFAAYFWFRGYMHLQHVFTVGGCGEAREHVVAPIWQSCKRTLETGLAATVGATFVFFAGFLVICAEYGLLCVARLFGFLLIPIGKAAFQLCCAAAILSFGRVFTTDVSPRAIGCLCVIASCLQALCSCACTKPLSSAVITATSAPISKGAVINIHDHSPQVSPQANPFHEDVYHLGSIDAMPPPRESLLVNVLSHDRPSQSSHVVAPALPIWFISRQAGDINDTNNPF